MSRFEILVLLLLLVMLLALGALHRMARRYSADQPWPFAQNRPLTSVEQILYYRLVQALPQYVVLAQVPMARFLRVRKGRPVREWTRRISQQSVDYLVCKPDFSIVAAIELDDPSHDRIDRIEADLTKNRALAGAGVPLVRWHVSALPDFDAIRIMIGTVLQDRSGGTEALPKARIEPTLRAAGLQTTHIEASNDPLIVGEEKRT